MCDTSVQPGSRTLWCFSFFPWLGFWRFSSLSWKVNNKRCCIALSIKSFEATDVVLLCYIYDMKLNLCLQVGWLWRNWGSSGSAQRSSHSSELFTLSQSESNLSSGHDPQLMIVAGSGIVNLRVKIKSSAFYLDSLFTTLINIIEHHQLKTKMSSCGHQTPSAQAPASVLQWKDYLYHTPQAPLTGCSTSEGLENDKNENCMVPPETEVGLRQILLSISLEYRLYNSIDDCF